MLISHEKKFIFLKTKKTAGTSIEVFLEEFCTAQPRAYRNGAEYRGSEATEIGVVGARQSFDSDEARLRRPVFYNHMTLDELKEVVPPYVISDYAVITSVRNPFEALLSRFWWELPADAEVRFDADHHVVFRAFNDFVLAIDESFNEKIYLDSSGGRKVDFFIRYESLRSDLTQVCDALGLAKNISKLQAFKSDARPAKPVFRTLEEWFSVAAIQHVHNVFGSELRRFGYSLSGSP